MKFLIGNIDVVQPEPPSSEAPPPTPQVTETKKTNWALYLLLGVIAFSLIATKGNK